MNLTLLIVSSPPTSVWSHSLNISGGPPFFFFTLAGAHTTPHSFALWALWVNSDKTFPGVALKEKAFQRSALCDFICLARKNLFSRLPGPCRNCPRLYSSALVLCVNIVSFRTLLGGLSLAKLVYHCVLATNCGVSLGERATEACASPPDFLLIRLVCGSLSWVSFQRK